MKHLLLVSGLLSLVLSARAAICLDIGAVAASNVLTGVNWDLSDGLKGWSGKWDPKHNPHRYLMKKETPKLGVRYVLSCRVRPLAEHARVGLKNFGVGCGVTWWDEKWKRADSVEVADVGLGEWKTLTTEPFVIPDWARTIGIFLKGAHGPDQIRDIRLLPADTELAIRATSDAAPVRQVRVIDEAEQVLWDSGVLKGDARTFATNVTVASRPVLTVLAIDGEGRVAVSGVGKE